MIEEFERDPHDQEERDSLCLKYWRAEKKIRDKRLSEVSDTVRLRRAKEAIQEVLNEAKIIARKKLSLSVICQMNSLLDVMLRGHNIQVENVKSSVVLKNQQGASLGQTLAVGYAFLTTLFRRAGHEFPFIVDAPVTALDGRVRNEIAAILPEVCPQFIGFVLDTERQDFVEKLDRVSNGNVQYLTAYEDSVKNEKLLATIPDSGVERTTNGVVVDGKDYFNTVRFPADSREVV